MKKAKMFLSVMLSALLVVTALPFVGCSNTRGEDDTTLATTPAPGTTPADTPASDASGNDTSATGTVAETTTAPAETTTAQQTSTGGYKVLNFDDFKAMWLSQYDLGDIYKSGSAQRSEASFTKYIDTILGNVKSLGFNTVIIQVRPNADSMYPSEFYPMSKYVVGGYGREAAYDPFAIMVERAHELGLSVQAWINPMRGMTDAEISKVPDKYQIRKWYDDKTTRGKQIVLKSGTWYLNPAYSEVRQLIIDGAHEILEKYDVDGLHMDDYFYPHGIDASFDSSAYNEYRKSGGRESLADWRRSNLDALVSGLWSMTKAENPEIIFGVSPAGNFKTVYESDYADIYEWCGKTGYIDYICPQVYFGFEHATCDFNKVVSTYQSMIKTDDVKLIVGMSLGKALSASTGGTDKYAGSGADEWIKSRDILKRQLEATLNYPKCTGVAYFCYQYFFNPVSGAQVSGTLKERQAFLPVLEKISWKK